MKVLVIPSNLNQTKLGEGVIIGIDGLSINYPCYFKVKDIAKIKNDVFVSLNKNIHNKDLEYLKEVLIELKNYNIKGLMFYDLSILNLAKKLNLNYDLIWHQEHMTNNYLTVNFYNSLGVVGSYISSDITLREMLEIKKNTKSKLFVNAFGYLPMFASYRHLVDNYIDTFSLKKKKNLTMSKEGKTYDIVDDKLGTVVYTSFILNGLQECLELNYDYIVLNSFNISNFKEVVNLFMTVNKNNVLNYDLILNKMFNNLGKGFFYEDTVYKVK